MELNSAAVHDDWEEKPNVQETALPLGYGALYRFGHSLWPGPASRYHSLTGDHAYDHTGDDVNSHASTESGL